LYGEWSVRVPHHTFCMVEPVIHFVWGLIVPHLDYTNITPPDVFRQEPPVVLGLRGPAPHRRHHVPPLWRLRCNLAGRRDVRHHGRFKVRGPRPQDFVLWCLTPQDLFSFSLPLPLHRSALTTLEQHPHRAEITPLTATFSALA
jgi:hypothetical protein